MATTSELQHSCRRGRVLTCLRYAFPNDELLPVNNGFSNSRNGWGASAVDALSTAVIMGEQEIVDQILTHIPTINWKQSYQNSEVSLFETTIRYLGGLLSGYDLLEGPAKGLVQDVSCMFPRNGYR